MMGLVVVRKVVSFGFLLGVVLSVIYVVVVVELRLIGFFIDRILELLIFVIILLF